MVLQSNGVALNTVIGWTVGDDIRVLIAAGIPVGVYSVDQIQKDMNSLGAAINGFVDGVLGLLDAYDAAQTALSTLNSESGGRVLIQADVLKWQAANPGQSYGPERELERIRYLLAQYFSSSPVFSGAGTMGTPLLRS